MEKFEYLEVKARYLDGSFSEAEVMQISNERVLPGHNRPKLGSVS